LELNFQLELLSFWRCEYLLTQPQSDVISLIDNEKKDSGKNP